MAHREFNQTPKVEKRAKNIKKTSVSSPKNSLPTPQQHKTGIQKPDLSKAVYGNFTQVPARNIPPSLPHTNALYATNLTNVVQREVQIWRAGRGEASAFDRRQELIDRMNRLTTGIVYTLDEGSIRYEITDENALTPFDRRMRAFIDREEIVPIRLITSRGYVGGGPLLMDSLQLGYADLDDLMASDDLGFQSVMMHFLTERFNVRNYAKRLGMASVGAEWSRVHPMGIQAEAALLRDVFNDPSIHHNWVNETSSRLVSAFRSREGRYHIFLIIRRGGSERRGAEISVRTRDGRHLSVDEFLAERAEAN